MFLRGMFHITKCDKTNEMCSVPFFTMVFLLERKNFNLSTSFFMVIHIGVVVHASHQPHKITLQ